MRHQSLCRWCVHQRCTLDFSFCHAPPQFNSSGRRQGQERAIIACHKEHCTVRGDGSSSFDGGIITNTRRSCTNDLASPKLSASRYFTGRYDARMCCQRKSKLESIQGQQSKKRCVHWRVFQKPTVNNVTNIIIDFARHCSHNLPPMYALSGAPLPTA